MNSRWTCLAVAVLMAVGMPAARAAEHETLVRTAEEIRTIKEVWNKRTHGRPVVINWNYMTVRSNQSPEERGERMFKKFDLHRGHREKIQNPHHLHA